MKRASPLPFPAYPTPPSPWQATSMMTNNLQSSPGGSPTPALTGKTSQVIEKLTAENDRLRRELKAERAAKDEALQQQRLLKAVVNQLEDKNSTLKHQFDTHDGALARKERRLDDLKAHLETELIRRRKAEDREAEMGRKLGDTAAEASKEVAKAKLAQKHVESAYQTVSKEYLDLRTRIESLTGAFAAYRSNTEDEMVEQESRFVQLEILLDQKRQALELATKVNRDQATVLQQYKEEIGDAAARRLEMIETTQKMRWLMGIYKAKHPEAEEREDSDEEEGS
jgi:chromosome segregation ATPase